MAEKHVLIPTGFTPELLADWFRRNRKDQFTHTKQTYYTDEEINQKSRAASRVGVEILRLEGLALKMKELTDKGLPEGSDPIIIEFVPTSGIKALKEERRRLDVDVSRGYDEIEMMVYGIPDVSSNEMVYFAITGEEVADRRRPLSKREIQEYGGIFSAARLTIDQQRTGTGS